MGERRVTGSTGSASGDELPGESSESVRAETDRARDGGMPVRASGEPTRNGESPDPTGRETGGLVTVEEWTPPSVGRAAGRVREYLTAAESLEFADPATHVDGSVTPAAVGLTEDRLLVVSDEGFVGLGLDRVCSVRSDRRTAYGLRGNDYRLVLAVGFLLATVGFVGVLAAAANPLTPTAALATLGGAFLVDHVRRTGADLDPVVAAVRRRDRGARLRRVKRRVNETASDDDLALAAAGALALVPFALVVAFEGGVAAPAFALLVVAGVGLAVHAFRHSEAFDGIEVVRRRQQTVRVTVDGGDAVVVRTHPESALARELAGLAQGPADGA